MNNEYEARGKAWTGAVIIAVTVGCLALSGCGTTRKPPPLERLLEVQEPAPALALEPQCQAPVRVEFPAELRMKQDAVTLAAVGAVLVLSKALAKAAGWLMWSSGGLGILAVVTMVALLVPGLRRLVFSSEEE